MSLAPRIVARKALLARARRMRHDYGYDEQKKKWTGPVERRDPRHYQQRSVIAITRCQNEHCRHWMSGERCPVCYTRRAS